MSSAAASITFVVPSVLNPGRGGEEKIPVRVSSLSDAFAKIVQMRGPDFARRVMEPDGKTPRQLINVYVNGKNAKFSGGMGTALKDGDEVYILPAVAGGGATVAVNDSDNGDMGDHSNSSKADELSAHDLQRFSRQVMLDEIGYNGQLRLKNAKVCVVGSGGLGNPICVRLAAMGIGALRIIDRDTIELTNLHRQILFDQNDIGKVKVEVAARKLRVLSPECDIEPLAISISEANAEEAVRGCDVVIDALDSVNARYALNHACIKLGIPFVTGAAVGVSGQAFTVLPQKKTACYYCVFPDLDEDSMPTCSIEGVHPSILSVVGGIEVAEAVKIIMGKRPSLSEHILHVDLDTMEFNKTRTFWVPECPVCGDHIRQQQHAPKNGVASPQELILEELCGRNQGKRTFAITPPAFFDVNVDAVSNMARQKGFLVENQGDLGLSMRTGEISISVMQKGSAVVVGSKDEQDAIRIYNDLIKATAV